MKSFSLVCFQNLQTFRPSLPYSDTFWKKPGEGKNCSVEERVGQV